MLLEPEVHQMLAQRASWYFDIDPKDRAGDSVMLTGDGLNDLDQVVGFIDRYPNGKFTVDTGKVVALSGAYPQFRICDREDVLAIRAAYVAFWGTTALDKPPHVGVL
jgi:hypothetical protein